MGEHGESQMVPWSCASIFGKNLYDLMKEYPETYGHLNLEKIANDARLGGWVVLKGKGSTEFGIGTSCVEIAKTIFSDERKVCMVSTLLKGQYGQENVYASVPAIVGKDGVIDIIELPLNNAELKEFSNSCEVMRKNFNLSLEY
jgi:L-lactate dehydrogenase